MPRAPAHPGLTNVQYAKLLVFTNGLVPLAMLIRDVATGQTGADKINYILHVTGMMALIFVMLTLSVTPLRKITGISFFMHFRRMLGLFAFFYAGLHLLTYLQLDRVWNFQGIVSDVEKRKFILFGMLAFALMIPLALTSTAGSVRRLGAAAWKRLHKLVYITAICAVVHYYLLVKADKTLPLIFAAVLGVLFGVRLLFTLVRPMARHRTARAAPDAA